MSNFRKTIDRALPAEPGLFDNPSVGEQQGAFEQTSLVKAAMSKAIRHSPYKRLEIAFRFSTYLGAVITEDLLNQMTSSKPEYQLKASQQVAFCLAVGNWILLDDILGSQEKRIMDSRDELAVRLADAVRRKHQAEREVWQAEANIREAERELERKR